MDKRRTKRITYRLKAERISGNIKSAVFIENLSENGIYMITTPAKTRINFTPDSPVKLKFQLSSGETLNLNCKVIWSHKIQPDGLANSVGMEIIAPPLKYKKFLKTLL
ncbi:MAG: PilZ domain-containing protein [Candidatus Mariimomonas ferrooxydans]